MEADQIFCRVGVRSFLGPRSFVFQTVEPGALESYDPRYVTCTPQLQLKSSSKACQLYSDSKTLLTEGILHLAGRKNSGSEGRRALCTCSNDWESCKEPRGMLQGRGVVTGVRPSRYVHVALAFANAEVDSAFALTHAHSAAGCSALAN